MRQVKRGPGEVLAGGTPAMRWNATTTALSAGCAPGIAYASADINAWANVFAVVRNTSGDADSTCSHSRSARFTLSGVAIALPPS